MAWINMRPTMARALARLLDQRAYVVAGKVEQPTATPSGGIVQFHDAGGERKEFRKLLANESHD
jgi:hypothetical protein